MYDSSAIRKTEFFFFGMPFAIVINGNQIDRWILIFTQNVIHRAEIRSNGRGYRDV